MKNECSFESSAINYVNSSQQSNEAIKGVALILRDILGVNSLIVTQQSFDNLQLYFQLQIRHINK